MIYNPNPNNNSNNPNSKSSSNLNSYPTSHSPSIPNTTSIPAQTLTYSPTNSNSPSNPTSNPTSNSMPARSVAFLSLFPRIIEWGNFGSLCHVLLIFPCRISWYTTVTTKVNPVPNLIPLLRHSSFT